MRTHEQINGINGATGYCSRGPNKGKPIWAHDVTTGMSKNRDGTYNPVAYKNDGTPIYNIDTKCGSW